MGSYAPPIAARVLCVDLDGTILATDTLWESLFVLLKRRPWTMLLLPMWLIKGKAYFKHQIAQRVDLDPATLPYRDDVLEMLRSEKESGREIILTTASHQKPANAIAQYLGLFSAVLASDGRVNVAGREKLKAVMKYVGSEGFDYVGDGKADLPLFHAAVEVSLVHPSQRVLQQVRRGCVLRHLLAPRSNTLRHALKAMRVHQWVKNVLVFVPAVTSHKITEGESFLLAICAFLSVSFFASSAYLTNDLFDLQSDRKHPEKRYRPLAAGLLPIPTAFILAFVLLTGGILISSFMLSPYFVATLGLYGIGTTAYSFYLKRVVVVDVIVLTGLYTLRIFAGALAINVLVSPWLLAFSMFLFLSLAFIKRYSELDLMDVHGETRTEGRGYLVQDRDLVRSLGVTSAYLSILVLALYINSKEVIELYNHPHVLWLVTPLLGYWITCIWFHAHRGEIYGDPVVFTLKKPAAYVVGALIGLIIVLATI